MIPVKCNAKDKATCRYHGQPLKDLEEKLKGYASSFNVIQYLKTKSAIDEIRRTSDDEITQEQINKFFKTTFKLELNSGTTFQLQNIYGKNQTSIRIAEKNELPVRCKRCSKPLTQDTYDAVNNTDNLHADAKCSYCYSGMNWNGIEPPYIVDIAYEDAQNFIADKEQVKEYSWYHVTTKKEWQQEASDAGVYVHLGTKQAALDRLSVINKTKYGESTYYMHEVKFNTKVAVANNVLSDDNEWPNELDDKDIPMDSKQIHRYINIWEEPGSVSLIANPNLFTVISSEKM